jgi:hypothetical protein
VTRRLGKNRPNLGKSGPNNYQNKKCLSIFIKAQLESSNRLHQTPCKLLKFLQQMIFFPKKFSWDFKIAKMTKFRPIWSPWLMPSSRFLPLLVTRFFLSRKLDRTLDVMEKVNFGKTK